MRNRKKRALLAVTGILCAVTIASTDTLVYAAPSAKELEKKTSNLKEDLNDLNNDMDVLSKKLDKTSDKIDKMSKQVEKAKLDLAAAKLNEESQFKSMKERIKFMYEGGNMSLFEILLSSDNMADFLNKAEYINNISDYDREMLAKFQNARKEVETKEAGLKQKQEHLSSMQDSLSEEKSNLNDKISNTSGKLSDYSKQLKKAKAAEEAMRTAQKDDVSGDTDNHSSGSSGASNSGKMHEASTSDVALLAGILECEAGISYEGMIAVGTVIMNRVESSRFPNSIREVVYQSGQFSPTWNGALNRVLGRGPCSSAYSAAKAVLGGARHNKVRNCYFFWASFTGHAGINVGDNVFW
ncbi:MAG: cell wall hydrolase [Lachnospiraceae bacterium]|nr:cell wall hydrolase [Lachnospiraceae bacterium]